MVSTLLKLNVIKLIGEIVKRSIIFLIILISSLSFSSAIAENRTFIKEYNYQASEYDSKVTCRCLAFEQVKRLLLEELGIYIESIIEVKNYHITKDEIVFLSAGIVQAEIMQEKWDGQLYFLKAKLTIDTENVANSVLALHRDRQKAKELEALKKQADSALIEIDRLKKELERTKSGNADRQKYNEAVNRLSATNWLEKGKNIINPSGNKEFWEKWRDAIDAFTKAIELNPTYADAYSMRAWTYGLHGEDRLAILDYNRAIELNPNANDYAGRGCSYRDIGDNQRAINDFSKSIELDSNRATTYLARGRVFSEINEYKEAINDYDKAIYLGLESPVIYYDRADAYEKLGDSFHAIINYKIAAQLGHEPSKIKLMKLGVKF